jgi:hypothetical protein
MGMLSSGAAGQRGGWGQCLRVILSEAKEPKRGYVSFASLRMTQDTVTPGLSG